MQVRALKPCLDLVANQGAVSMRSDALGSDAQGGLQLQHP